MVNRVLWLSETFSTSPLKSMKGIQRNLKGSKISTSSTKFVFFGPIGKTRWPPLPLIGWDIFDFFSETAERNSTKPWQHARSQRSLPSFCFSGRSETQDGRPGLWFAETFLTSSLKLLKGIQWNLTGSKTPTSSTKFVFFGDDRKNKMAALASDWLRQFRLLLWNYWKEFNETWQEVRSQRPQPSLCFIGSIGKTRWQPWRMIGWDIFDFFSETAERKSKKLDREQDLNFLYQVCVFQAERKNKMAALASDLLRHFRLLLWNRWTELNETWQHARSQRPLPSFVFFGSIGNTRWPPWPLICWDIFDFFSETSERNSMKLDRKQDLNVLYQVCVFRDDSETQDGRPGLWLA